MHKKRKDGLPPEPSFDALQRIEEAIIKLQEKVECLMATYSDLSAEVQRITDAVARLESISFPAPGEALPMTQAQLDAITAQVKADADRLEKVGVTTAPGAGSTSQTISFGSVSSHTVNDAPFAVSAGASSGLPVTFKVKSGPATVSGGTITLTGTPGTVVVTASQAGNATYAAAPDVDASFTVSL